MMLASDFKEIFYTNDKAHILSFPSGNGWNGIILNMCVHIMMHASEKKIDPPKIYSIKNKWGVMKVTSDDNGSNFSSIISFAESQSKMTCQICGKIKEVSSQASMCKSCTVIKNSGFLEKIFIDENKKGKIERGFLALGQPRFLIEWCDESGKPTFKEYSEDEALDLKYEFEN
jgi:hypothetical protein